MLLGDLRISRRGDGQARTQVIVDRVSGLGRVRDLRGGGASAATRPPPTKNPHPAPRVRRKRNQPAYAFLVSQKIFAISSIFARSLSATSGSAEPFAPEAPASFVASFTSAWSCGYFSKCGGLK